MKGLFRKCDPQISADSCQAAHRCAKGESHGLIRAVLDSARIGFMDNLRMPIIEPGKKAPAFSLKDQHGKVHRLSDYTGRPVILYFYPKDDTPGCRKESCEFQAALPRLKPASAVVLGISILDEA